MNQIVQKKLNDTSDPNSLSSKFRRKRNENLRSLISSISYKNNSIKILDLGGSIEYWRQVGIEYLRDVRAIVTVLNYSEQEIKSSNDDPDIFRNIVGDACDLSRFRDNEFDLTHSNSVIEHVGDWGRVQQFAAEAKRVGKNYYIQTPNYWFPIDPHRYKAPMIHWMPRPIQARLLENFSICTAGRAGNLSDALSILDGTRLLDRREMKFLFPEASLEREVFVGLTKSLIAIHTP